MVSPLDSDDAPIACYHKRYISHVRLCEKGACTLHPPVNSPTRFSETAKAPNIICDPNGLLISYDTTCQEARLAASVRSNISIPVSGIALYYFEVVIVNQGNSGRIGIGLCERKVKLSKMPGSEHGSYAYHGDGGHIFEMPTVCGSSYGPKYGTNDTIGCCWDLVDNVVFFTKNGEKLGPAFRDLSGELFPVIGMQSIGGQIEANFGSSAYSFDIESYAQQQREKVLMRITALHLPSAHDVSSNIVLSYLVHNGYSQTAAVFAEGTGRMEFFKKEEEFMSRRQAICQKVTSGDIDGAITDIEAQFPGILEQHLHVRFLLHTQRFIDMLIAGSRPEVAVEYGLKNLSTFQNLEELTGGPKPDYDGESANLIDGSYSRILRHVCSLLAYPDPTTSPESRLTEPRRREMVADHVNSALLGSRGLPICSLLERLITQNRNVMNHLTKLGNGSAALVSDKDVF